MHKCPMCESDRVVISVSPRHPAFCTRCGARWTQDDAEQRAVHRLDPSPPNISTVSVQAARALNIIGRPERP